MTALLKKLRKAFNCQMGMSLIEILVAVAIGSVVSLGIYSMFKTQSKLFSGENKVMRMNSQAKTAMELLTKKIRLLGYNPLECPSHEDCESNIDLGLQGYTNTATAVGIEFTADYNEDGTLDFNNAERIHIQWDGSDDGTGNPVNEIQLGIIDSATGARSGWQTMATSISALSFRYYYEDGTNSDASGLPISDTSYDYEDIRAIEVTVTAQLESAHNLTGDTALLDPISLLVKLRNVTGDDL